MRKISIVLLIAFMGAGFASFAATGKLFTITRNFNQITITPTSNHYYPSMGIKITSNNTVNGCDISGNGYCLFSASPDTPKTLVVSGAGGTIEGNVCLNGPGAISCQKFSLANACMTHGTCRVFLSSIDSFSDMQPDAPVPGLPIPNQTGVAGGNAICQKLADNAKLGGIWRAWLSNIGYGFINAPDNIGYDPTIRYIRPISRLTIAQPGTLLSISVSNRLINPILETEYGIVDEGVDTTIFSWTGTNALGQGLPYNCDGWTTRRTDGRFTAGEAERDISTWTDAAQVPPSFTNCSFTSRLYCFEKPDSN